MAYDFTNVKVLVVESTPEMFRLIKQVLSMLKVPNKNIDAAYSHEEAFNKFCKRNHDFVITDWLKNPDAGIQLTKNIRTHKKTPNQFVPIIMTAGSSHYNRVIKSRDAGISEYLVKPFSAKMLADRISRLVESPRSFVLADNYVGHERRIRQVEYDGEERRVEEPKIV